jgi:Malic enzyme, NAD binding domain
MVERPYELAWTPDGMVARVRLRGSSVLTSPLLNDGVRYQIAQANNALIFPGLGLGVTVCRARRISDQMLAAAACALADLTGPAAPGAALLPPGHQPAHHLRCRRDRRRPGRGGRGPGPDHAGRPSQTGSRSHVGTQLPPHRAHMNTAGSMPQPRRDLIAGAGDLAGDMADDGDPVETRQWLDSQDAVLEFDSSPLSTASLR